MAYFLGKGMNANMDDLFPREGNKAQCLEKCKEQLALDPGFDYQGCVDGCGGMRVQPGEVTTPGTIAGPAPDQGTDLGTESVAAKPEGGTNYLDDLIAGMFGKGFETVRGVGGRTRESVFDALGREGLLGTGATKDVAQDIAWQTERGISDLMRGAQEMKYAQEQDAMNQMLQLLFSMMGAWR